MNKKRLIAFLILIIVPLGVSAFYFPATSKNTDVVITEIGAFESRSKDCEWIEIYNRSSTSVSIKDWKLWEQQSNHKIETGNNTDSYEIAPQEYAVIADRPQSLLSNNTSTCKYNYDIPTSTPLFATEFSYGLKNNGEEIGLKRSNSFSDTVEKFTYESFKNEASLERISAKKLDYTKDNWKSLSANTTTPNHTLGSENYYHSTEGKIEEFNPDIALISSSSITKQVSSTFSASSSNPKKFEWNFVNKNKTKPNRNNQQIQSTGATVQYNFDQSGEYIVNLLNYDQQGAVAATNTSIAVSQSPTALITAPTSTKTHTSTLVSGKNSSSSPLTEITSYLWNFNENNSSTSTGPTTTYNYTNTGTYKINLNIKDDNLGSDKASSSIKVLPNTTKPNSNQKPDILASSSAHVNEKINFKADPINSSTNYIWNINQSIARGVTTTYTFSNTSTYRILLTVSSTDYTTTATHKIKITEDSNTASNSTTTTSTSSDKITINEILPDSNNGNEWIELYNPGKEKINLSGWTLSDKVSTITSLDQTISSSEFFTYTLSGAKLNNGGDSVILKNKNNKIIDQITYSDSGSSASIPETGNSIARTEDGASSNNNENSFVETTQPTKNKKNKISRPNNNEDDNGETTELFEEDEETKTTYSGDSKEEKESKTIQNSSSFKKSTVLINEILPDPKNTKEFVEIHNNTEQEINLTKWKLKDGAENTINLSNKISPKEYKVIEQSSSYLNNEGDLLKLISPNDKIIDKVIYGNWETSENNLAPKPPEGRSLSRVKNNKDTDNYKKDFEITTVTKNKKNLNSKTETSTPHTSSDKLKPQLKLKGPTSAQVGETVTFSVNLSSNYNSNNLVWIVNTDKIAENKKEIKHSFKEAGLYTIIAKIRKDGKDVTNAAKKIRVENKPTAVGGYIPTENLDKIKINEILPNPEGSDKKEFIELFNPTTKPIPLGKAQIDDEESGSNPHQISSSTVIKPQSYLVLPKKKTGISLNNSGDEVRVLARQKEPITKIKYQQAPEGKSFDGKVWSKIQTPGFKNKILRQKTNSQITQQTTNKTGFKKVPLGKISNMKEGNNIITTGVVTVAPQKIKERVFYIQGSPGLQIYNHDKDFPDLAPGDKINVKGELSRAYGHWRLKTEDKNSIKKIDHKGTPRPEKIQAEEIDNNLASRLVQLQGEVTEKNKDQFYLNDKTGEVEVEIKEETEISLAELDKKDLVKVSGIVNKKSDEYKILPRKSSDIEKTGTANTKQKTETSTQLTSENTTEKYLIATAGAIIVILITLLLKEKQKS